MHRENDLDRLLEPLRAQLSVVSSEAVQLADAVGRVLRKPILADRDSPAADVSAMDGYALRLDDLTVTDAIPVVGECLPGRAPLSLPKTRSALRIFTGALVPPNAALVVKREDTQERPDSICLTDRARTCRSGENIRFQGENTKAGSVVVDQGGILHAGSVAAAANFGASELTVSRRLRVAILTTGDELIDVGSSNASANAFMGHTVLSPWQLRDSNGPTLRALMAHYRWLELTQATRVHDDFEALCGAMQHVLQDVDVLLLTGGVSAGDFDFVPAALKHIGGSIVFHKLPIRPGKPILGGLGPRQQLVMGLPGNPVSAAVCALRFAIPLMSHMAGTLTPNMVPEVSLPHPDTKTLGLHWFRLVRWDSNGQLALVASQGSGDLVSLATSCGFIEIPPHQSGIGPWPFWQWPQ